ncbi:MAG: gamma-glutamyltransferase [Ignavibacteria bacterium]
MRILIVLLSLLLGLLGPSDETAVTEDYYYNGVVSSADRLASEVGIKILQEGGNAIDAAVGVGFALAVVYPQAGNIGGGGFMVIRLADGTATSIDFREKAPLLATRNMYLDINGNVIENLSTIGHLAAGVPGSVAGLLYALEKYGTMSRQQVMKYAIELAENGFVVSEHLADAIRNYNTDFKKFEGSYKIFKNVKANQPFFQKDLASTLKAIRDYGRDGFYKGKVADLIVNEMKGGNGIISYKDLEDYNVIEREVLRGTYRGYDIITMRPPSSGGICLLEFLNILEYYNLSSITQTEYVHLLTEVMKRVYADRAEFMGDDDFVNVPVDILTSKVYAKRRMESFNENKASTSVEIKPGDAYYKESINTTHYSVADKYGNVVATTTTLNDNFGCKVVVDGAGFLLNNEMDDFAIKPNYPNIYGLIGSEANSIAPGKRMLSSMTPTIVLKDNKPFLVLGSPGGGKIITAVLQTIVHIIDFNRTLSDAIEIRRFHHQWLPDYIQYEQGCFPKTVVSQLMSMGHNLKEVSNFGRIDAIMIFPDGRMTGHSDSRGYGKALGY